jgi:hypothetical protein
MRTAWLITALAAAVSAAPSYPRCLSDREAKELVDATVQIFTSNDPTDLVMKYFTVDYHQWSDSTNFIVPPEIAPVSISSTAVSSTQMTSPC